MQEYQVSLEIENTRERPINFVLEPWGEIYTMESGAKFTVVFQSSLNGIPTIQDGVDSVTVWGWVESTALLFLNGEEVGESDQRPHFPQTPPRIS